MLCSVTGLSTGSASSANMYTSYERYSQSFGKRLVRGFLLPCLRLFVLVFFLHLLLVHFFLASFAVETNSMYPALERGNRVLVSPLIYGARILSPSHPLPGLRRPGRGDLVVVISPAYGTLSFPLSFLEPLVRFFTLQKGSLARDFGGRVIPKYMVKRIIGLPGDTVMMTDYQASIKPEGHTVFYREKELITTAYTPQTQMPAKGWKSEFPFSGNLAPVLLGEDEFFLLGDNRPFSSDSRSWGKMKREKMLGKVFLRYWPLHESGRL